MMIKDWTIPCTCDGTHFFHNPKIRSLFTFDIFALISTCYRNGCRQQMLFCLACSVGGVCVWWLFGGGVVSLLEYFYSAGTATVKTEIFLTNVNRTGTD